MSVMRWVSYSVPSITCLVFLTMFAASSAVAGGDRHINLSLLIKHAFRLQFDSSQQIERNFDRARANRPPDAAEPARALQLSPQANQTGTAPLTCADITVQGYEDWLLGSQRAQQKRKAAKGNRRTRDMFFPNFVFWNAPVYVRTLERKQRFGALRKARFSVAVLGPTFDETQVFSEETRWFTPATLDALSDLTGWGHAQWIANAQGDFEIEVEQTVSCAAFTIFELNLNSTE